MAAAGISFAESLDSVLELRPFPAVASRLITACDSEDSTARQLSDIIKHDPGLSLKLLQMSNSSMYGFAGEIRSVDHATVVLGRRAVRNLAISMAVGDVFATGDSASASARKDLWIHSLTCGAIARSLASAIKMHAPDEAFLGGIVHDVGKLFFYDHNPGAYLQAISVVSHSDVLMMENETFGIAHTSIGQKCGQSWGLPEEINDVICFHHAPNDADFGGELIAVVAAANRLCRVWTVPVEDCETVSAEILDSAGFDLTMDDVRTLHHAAMADVDAILLEYA